jgi:60S ribosome subunit biogenesis protein NIP7
MKKGSKGLKKWKRKWNPLTNKERVTVQEYLLRFGVDIIQMKGKLIRIERRVFLVDDTVYGILKMCGGEGVYAAGVEMGVLNSEFEPSISCADVVAEMSCEKIVINEKGEKLFSYGRDVFLPNIVGGTSPGDTIVVNERGEVLGIGYFNGEMLENVVDKGFYLRGKKGRAR